MSYHHHYIKKLKAIQEVANRDIAVLGCSFGKECELLINEGANSITGVDLSGQIGKDFKHRRVSYLQESLTDCSLKTDEFDIVYSVAVFEHVHDLKSAFQEAVRICKPGGFIFIISSPVWFSPYGNHMNNMLPHLPWAHLLFTPNQLKNEIEKFYPELAKDLHTVNGIIERVYDPVYFNHLPSLAYIAAAEAIKGVKDSRNVCWPAALDIPNHDKYFKACVKRGYRSEELTIGAHYFEARKLV